MNNLSKQKKWDTYFFMNPKKSDFYFTYDLKKSERGKYLNTWFSGIILKSKNNEHVYRDEMITLKKVDKDTSFHLYNRIFNPVSIVIMCPTGAKFKQDKNGNDLYQMKAQIHSIDDSSYGIWWNEIPFTKLEEIREKLMITINSYPIINGEKFLEFCLSLGADEESKDYN